jgi:rubrerythrin
MARIDSISTPRIVPARRTFVAQAGTLSAAAIALLAGCDTMAAQKRSAAQDPAADVNILNSALAAEHQGVAAYQVGAESGLLQKPVLDLAVQFQGHHKAHADLLAATVSKLGGSPVEPKQTYAFPVEQLKTQADVLRFAAGLEQGAVSAYLGAVPVLDDRELARAAASILGDEAMHLAVLRHALGENPVPGPFVG